MYIYHLYIITFLPLAILAILDNIVWTKGNVKDVTQMLVTEQIPNPTETDQPLSAMTNFP